jgi:hypothetical protein
LLTIRAEVLMRKLLTGSPSLFALLVVCVGTVACRDPDPLVPDPLAPNSPLIEEARGRYHDALRDGAPKQGVADFVGWLTSLDEVELAWTDVTGLEVTARLSDGRLTAYEFQRRQGLTPPADRSGLSEDDEGRSHERDIPPTSVLSTVGNAMLASGFPDPPTHPEIIETLEPWVDAVGFDVDSGGLTVEWLTRVDQYDLVLLHSHGNITPLPDPAGTPTWRVTTTDTWDDVGGTISDVELTWPDEVADGLLIPTHVDWEDDGSGDDSRAVWAVTERFIGERNGTMKTNSLVMLQTCLGFGGCDTFTSMGASGCTGWTESVLSSFNARASRFAVESMIGHQHDGVDAIEPPMRALSVGETRAQMSRMGLARDTDDPDSDPRLRLQLFDELVDVGLLPALWDVQVTDGFPPAFRIDGRFGDEAGTVEWDGNEVPFAAWGPDAVVLSASPVGGTGALVVYAGNGAVPPSNPAHSAAFAGSASIALTHPWYIGTVTVQGTGLQVVGGFYDAWNGGYRDVERTIQWRPGSSMSWDISGSFLIEDGTLTTSGVGSGPVEPGSLVWVLDGDDVGTWNALTAPVVHTATTTDPDTGVTTQQSFPGTASLSGGSAAAPIATTADHDAETGEISSGDAFWSGVAPAGLTSFSMFFGPIDPSPPRDPDAPR